MVNISATVSFSLTHVYLFIKKKRYFRQVLIETAEWRGRLLVGVIKGRWSQTSRSRKYEPWNKFCIQRKHIYLQVNCLWNGCRHAKYGSHILKFCLTILSFLPQVCFYLSDATLQIIFPYSTTVVFLKNVPFWI